MTKERAIEISVELRRLRQRLYAIKNEVVHHKVEGEYAWDTDAQHRLIGQTIAHLDVLMDATGSSYIMFEVWHGIRDEAEKLAEDAPPNRLAQKESKENA